MMLRYGKWIYDETIGGMKHYYCSNCKKVTPGNECFADENQILWFKFCPKCGAEMNNEQSRCVLVINIEKIKHLCREIEDKSKHIADSIDVHNDVNWILSQEIVGLSQAIAELVDTKPVTNGDFVREALRNVSDRTLAYMFNFCDIFDDDCPNCPLNGQHCEKVSPKVLYDWLQEEVEYGKTC